LQPGANQLTAFTTHGTIGSLLAYVEWREAFRGMD